MSVKSVHDTRREGKAGGLDICYKTGLEYLLHPDLTTPISPLWTYQSAEEQSLRSG